MAVLYFNTLKIKLIVILYIKQVKYFPNFV